MNNDVAATTTSQAICTFHSSPGMIIAQCVNLLILLLVIGVAIYVVNLLRRIANAQEATAKHLATLAAKNDGNGDK